MSLPAYTKPFVLINIPACGDSKKEALKMGKEAIELHLHSLKDIGQEIPIENETFEYKLTVKAPA